MIPETTKSLTLSAFCQTVRKSHAVCWPPTEDALANGFIEYFDYRPMLQLADLQSLCEDLGIECRKESLPESLWGHNIYYAGKREILISQSHKIPGAEEHTILHELRELLECEFKMLGYPTLTLDNEEARAESFAIAVRLRIFAKSWLDIFSGVAQINSPLPRWLAYAVLVVCGIGSAAGIALLPKLENEFADGARITPNKFEFPETVTIPSKATTFDQIGTSLQYRQRRRSRITRVRRQIT